MLDEMLGRLTTSANILGIAHTFSLKKLRAICILIMVSSLKRTAPSQRIQIMDFIKMLNEMLDEMLGQIVGHLNTSPNICKICCLKCWMKR